MLKENDSRLDDNIEEQSKTKNKYLMLFVGIVNNLGDYIFLLQGPFNKPFTTSPNHVKNQENCETMSKIARPLFRAPFLTIPMWGRPKKGYVFLI